MKITINGTEVEVGDGKNINITSRNGSISIGGNVVSSGLSGTVKLVLEGGIIANVEADGSVSCGAVTGNATAGGSVTCGDVGGNASAGGTVRCDKVGGSANAGGSVHCSS